MLLEIWSDIVCPWCYIGKRRLETAIERFERRDAVTVIWRSFQLDPSTPRNGTEPTRAMLARKYGVSLEEADAMQSRVVGLAAAEGLAYRIDLTRHENTFDAHRLIHFAKTRDLQEEMKERCMAAYFLEGASVGDHGTLIRLAGEVGLDGGEATAVLAGDTYAEDVRADIARAAALEIRGVPFFVFAERYGVSGAQSADTLLQVLTKAWEESGDAERAGEA